jgi:hypothetical protein
MTLYEKTIDKITVKILADKSSKYYLTDHKDILHMDDDYILHQIAMLKAAGKKGVFEIQLTPISINAKDRIIEAENRWVKANSTKIKSGGIITMLLNKGF